MRRSYLMVTAIVAGALLGAGAASAADISIVGKKLVIVDKLVSAGKAKAVLVAKDPGVTKGAGIDAALIEAQLDVSYDSVAGAFLAPQGAGWLINKSTIAKYVNKPAPVGGATKVSVIKPGKLLKLVAKSLGDTPIDISAAPTGDVSAIYTVTNDGETNRHCTAFPTCTHKVIGGGTGYKLVCKGGAAAACPVGSTTTSSTTISSTTTSSTTTSSTTTSSTTTTLGGIQGPAFPPPGGNVNFSFSGNANDPAGSTLSFFNFTPNTTWSELYWGSDSNFPPSAGLDGTPHALTFAGIAGTIATFAGTTNWTNPADLVVHMNVPIELRLDVSGLGGTPWVLSTSIPGLDPGPGTGIGAVVDDSASQLDFDINFKYVADLPTDGIGNFIAFGSVPTTGGGLVNSSFTGAFYTVAP